MFNNINNFFNLKVLKRFKTVLDNDDVIPLGTKDHRYLGGYKPTAMQVGDFIAGIPTGPETFLELTDTPGTYIGQGGLFPQVNPGETGLIFAAAPAGINTMNYTSTAFVDPVNGNNGTAVVGDGNLPFLTPDAAAAVAPHVLLTPGNYAVFVNLVNGVDYYCMDGVNFVAGGFRDFVSTGKKCRVSGHAIFTGTSEALQVLSNAEVDFEFNYMNDNRRVVIANSTAIVRMSGNWILCNSFNGSAIAASGRDSSQIHMRIKHYFHAQHNAVATGPSVEATYSGSFYIECPDIRTIPNYTTSFGNAAKNTYLGFSGVDCDVTIVGDQTCAHNVLIATSAAITMASMPSGGTPGRYKFIGKVDGFLNRAYSPGAGSSEGEVHFIGDIVSQISPIYCNLSGTLTGNLRHYVRNARISGFANVIGRGRTFYFRDCTFEHTGAGPLLAGDPTGASISEIYTYNCDMVSAAAGASSTFAAIPGGWIVGCRNTESTEPIGAGVVDIFGGFAQNAALTISNF